MADIDFGQLSEALNNKSDRDLRNVDTTAKADAVIDYQEPTADNGYTWYRKYKSGWVEQGGRASKGQTSITLPVEMADNKYFVYKTLDYGSGSVDWNETNSSQTDGIVKTTTGFVCGTRNGDWEVKGMAAN